MIITTHKLCGISMYTSICVHVSMGVQEMTENTIVWNCVDLMMDLVMEHVLVFFNNGYCWFER